MKKKPLIDWEMTVDFYAIELKVKARTKVEARKKAMAKLEKVNLKKHINKNCTFLDKAF